MRRTYRITIYRENREPQFLTVEGAARAKIVVQLKEGGELAKVERLS